MVYDPAGRLFHGADEIYDFIVIRSRIQTSANIFSLLSLKRRIKIRPPKDIVLMVIMDRSVIFLNNPFDVA